MTDNPIYQQLLSARQVFAPYPVDIAYFHGSAALGQSTPLSDIDLAVVVKAEVPANRYLDIELDLALALEKSTHLKNIDLRIINQAPLEVKGKILENGRLLFSRDEAKRVDFETSTRNRYFDFLPIANYMHHQFFKHTSREGLLG